MKEQEDIISVSTLFPVKLGGFKLTPFYLLQVNVLCFCVPWCMVIKLRLGYSARLISKYMETPKCFQQC